MFYSCNKYIHLFILHQLCGGICSFGKNMRFILIWVISIEVPLPFHCPSWTPSTSAAPREWSSRSWTRAPWRAATPTRRSPACCAPCPEQPVVQGSDLTDLADSKWSKRSFHFGSLNIHACSIWGGAASVSHFRHSTFSLTVSTIRAAMSIWRAAKSRRSTYPYRSESLSVLCVFMKGKNLQMSDTWWLGRIQH